MNVRISACVVSIALVFFSVGVAYAESIVAYNTAGCRTADVSRPVLSEEWKTSDDVGYYFAPGEEHQYEAIYCPLVRDDFVPDKPNMSFVLEVAVSGAVGCQVHIAWPNGCPGSYHYPDCDDSDGSTTECCDLDGDGVGDLSGTVGESHWGAYIGDDGVLRMPFDWAGGIYSASASYVLECFNMSDQSLIAGYRIREVETSELVCPAEW